MIGNRPTPFKVIGIYGVIYYQNDVPSSSSLSMDSGHENNSTDKHVCIILLARGGYSHIGLLAGMSRRNSHRSVIVVVVVQPLCVSAPPLKECPCYKINIYISIYIFLKAAFFTSRFLEISHVQKEQADRAVNSHWLFRWLFRETPTWLFRTCCT